MFKIGLPIDPLLREQQMSKKELMDALEDKRKNLTMKESKAGKFLKKQIEEVRSQAQKESNFITDLE